MEIVVLRYQLLQLALDVDYLIGWELELGDGHSSLFQVAQESSLTRLEEHQTAALGIGTRRTTYTVDVVARVIRRIELDNPIDGRNIKTTSCNVGAE